MFKKTARFYDAIYSSKDYEGESKRVHELIQEHCPKARTLLDVGCGTGGHLRHLMAYYDVEGLDVDPQMVAIARERHPEVVVHEADMVDFNLAKQFDAVTCLFASIPYVQTVADLGRAVARMVAHLRPSGILIVEPWVFPEVWESGKLGAVFVDEPGMKIARIGTGWTEGRVCVMDLHYLIATENEGITYSREQHRLGLFTHAEYISAFEQAGVQVAYDPDGLTGRGLYVGVSQEGKAS